MIELMSEQGKGVTFREAQEQAFLRYFEGFRAGFRSCYCGQKCKFTENCEIRDLCK